MVYEVYEVYSSMVFTKKGESIGVLEQRNVEFSMFNLDPVSELVEGNTKTL